MLHEADLMPLGVEGSGLTHVEHFEAQSFGTAGSDAYTNCYYICRYCNIAKNAKPVLDPLGRRLLDPCSTPWASHFAWVGFELKPLDGDATWTWEAYDLDDERKVVFRRHRVEFISRRLEELMLTVPQSVKALSSMFESVPAEKQLDIVQMLARLDVRRSAILSELRNYEVIPEDAPTACACGATLGTTPLYAAPVVVAAP